MSQSKIESLAESTINIVIGYVVATISQLLIFPMVGINIPFTTNLWIGVWFTCISLIRSYVIRRWFNARLQRTVVRIAQMVENK